MILDCLPKHIEDNRSFWHFRKTRVETRGKESTIFHSISPRLAKICPLAEFLGLAVLRNHKFEKRKMSSFKFFRSSKLSILRCQDQNLARFFPIVFYRCKMLRCDLSWRKQFGDFSVRYLSKWIKKGTKVVLFGISSLQGSNGKKKMSSKIQRKEFNR